MPVPEPAPHPEPAEDHAEPDAGQDAAPQDGTEQPAASQQAEDPEQRQDDGDVPVDAEQGVEDPSDRCNEPPDHEPAQQAHGQEGDDGQHDPTTSWPRKAASAPAPNPQPDPERDDEHEQFDLTEDGSHQQQAKSGEDGNGQQDQAEQCAEDQPCEPEPTM